MEVYYTNPTAVMASRLESDHEIRSGLVTYRGRPGDWLVNKDGAVSICSAEEFRTQFRSEEELRTLFGAAAPPPPPEVKPSALRSGNYQKVLEVLGDKHVTFNVLRTQIKGIQARSLYNLLGRGRRYGLWTRDLQGGWYRSEEQLGSKSEGLTSKLVKQKACQQQDQGFNREHQCASRSRSW